jgi:hypothetical protein
MLIDPNGAPIIPQQMKCFPVQWSIGKAKVVLHADGRCTGDVYAALEEIKNLPPDPNAPLLWLLANAISQQITRSIDEMEDLIDTPD